MSIAKKAIKDAEEVSRLAVAAATNELVESLSPVLRKIVSSQLRSGKISEDIDRLRRAADGHGETEFEEGKTMDKKEDDLDMESLAGMFPSISENEDADEDDLGEAKEDEVAVESADEVEETAIPTLGEADDMEGDMDEEIEISEAELAKFFQEGIQLEAQVSKGFKDMTPAGELDDVDPAAGIADFKSGEKTWDGETPPAKQDWTVKESVRDLIKRGIAENKRLKNENAKLRKLAVESQKRLAESNLFNAKVLHINKFMNKHRLTLEQKKAVIEAVDAAQSISEVKRAYSILETTFKAGGVVAESRASKPRTTSAQRRTSGNPDAKVLRESVDRGGNDPFGRMRQLAGILPKK